MSKELKDISSLIITICHHVPRWCHQHQGRHHLRTTQREEEQVIQTDNAYKKYKKILTKTLEAGGMNEW
jgi:hypothetical protein